MSDFPYNIKKTVLLVRKCRSLYHKLILARSDIQKMNLKMTGKNNYAGFSYYTLADIIPAIKEVSLKYEFCCITNFTNEKAVLQIVDIYHPENKIIFESPMREANTKGCNPIQDLGSTETYLRRYLYLLAFDIVECDTFDATSGAPNKFQEPRLTYITLAQQNIINKSLTVDQITALLSKYNISDLSKLAYESGVKVIQKINQTRFKSDI